MSNPKESGYEQNVVNFSEIIESVLGHGAKFNPAKAVLGSSSLQSTLIVCKEANTAVRTATINYKSAVDDREAAFKELQPLLTRVANAMKVSGISAENIATAKEFLRKAQGKRVPAKKTNGTEMPANDPTTKQISVSQMGYDNRIKNAANLFHFLASKSYKPNELELQPESLIAFLTDLEKKNAAVISAASALFDARSRRNELMFKDGTGLVPVAQEVKLYIKSLFGPGSDQFKKISKIKFSRN